MNIVEGTIKRFLIEFHKFKNFTKKINTFKQDKYGSEKNFCVV